MSENEKTSQCELCLRKDILVTKHHLIPQSEHARILKKHKKYRPFSKDELHNRVIWICRPCHSQVHAVLTNQELAYEYNTLEKLQSVDDITKFADWIAKKPVGLKVTVRRKK